MQNWLILQTGASPRGYDPSTSIIRTLVKACLEQFTKADQDSVDNLGDAQSRLGFPSDLQALHSVLDPQGKDPEWDGLEPRQRQTRVMKAWTAMLSVAAGIRPIIIAIEDLHWIDEQSATILAYAIENLRRSPVCFVATSRDPPQAPWATGTGHMTLVLDRMDVASAQEMTGALLGDDPSLADLRDLLIARCAGIPLLLEEIVRALVEAGSLSGAPARIDWNSHTKRSKFPPPYILVYRRPYRCPFASPQGVAASRQRDRCLGGTGAAAGGDGVGTKINLGQHRRSAQGGFP